MAPSPLGPHIADSPYCVDPSPTGASLKETPHPQTPVSLIRQTVPESWGQGWWQGKGEVHSGAVSICLFASPPASSQNQPESLFPPAVQFQEQHILFLEHSLS